ncbi:hypothetical protein tloyanaT_08190 [Thalassotalea loyana]|uniref:Uncharacterized protein n=1 Tax=Thalassotalea loyana TaxID=280483 RepID=A0ABQ6H8W5_9GAMM|nr:hypothetical protein [Thalassotalea loyana]GLX84567.1 hypothetical protein tloyanaT_08190 [Thalassotalea loyana]
MKLYEVMIVAIPVKIFNLIISVIPAYFLWNWIVPDVFSLPEIGVIQMTGLIILIQCITSNGFISLNTEGF